MSAYLTEKMKPSFKIRQTGNQKCRLCKRSDDGKYVTYEDRLTAAIDGTMAHRIYFVCNEKGHLNFIGYSKPVDFSQGKSKWDAIDNVSYEEQEEELEAGWKEAEENALLRRRTFYRH